jgi:hypothetical protein
VLEVKRNLVAADTLPAPTFVATGTHRVILSGSGYAGRAEFGGPGRTFNTLVVTNPAGAYLTGVTVSDTLELVAGSGEVFVTDRKSTAGTVVLSGDARLSGYAGFVVEGDLVAGPSTTVGVSPLWLNGPGGSTTIDGALTSLVVRFAGAGAVIDPGFTYTTVEVAGPVELSGRTVATSHVVVTDPGAALDLMGHTLQVGGNFTTASGGVLVMRSAADTLDVQGSATFDGGSTEGLLTAGVLQVGGYFAASAVSSPQSFAASGSHKTRLVGATTHTIALDTPGATAQRFNELEVPGMANFASGGYVTAALRLLSGSSFNIPDAAKIVDVEGVLQYNGSVSVCLTGILKYGTFVNGGTASYCTGSRLPAAR